MTWSIERFEALVDELNAKIELLSYIDSPNFIIMDKGPVFFLRLYTKGIKKNISNFSLFLKLKTAGTDKRWKYYGFVVQ